MLMIIDIRGPLGLRFCSKMQGGEDCDDFHTGPASHELTFFTCNTIPEYDEMLEVIDGQINI
jgi:hypothetical protein